MEMVVATVVTMAVAMVAAMVEDSAEEEVEPVLTLPDQTSHPIPM